MKLVDGTIECTTGPFKTKDNFGAFQLHLEWYSPANFEGDWATKAITASSSAPMKSKSLTRSKSTTTLTALRFRLRSNSPLVNACTPAGNWQTYDIFFKPAKFDGDTLIESPRVTILQNGILIQNNTEIYGETNHFSLPDPHPKGKGPIILSGHGCPVRFRNIWIRSFDD